VQRSCACEIQMCEHSGPGSVTPDVYARHSIYASWASSAVVQTIVDGYGYFDQVKKALPTNCSLDIIAAVQYADNAFSSSNATLSLAVQRKVIGSGDPNPESAAFMMQQPFEEFQVRQPLRPVPDTRLTYPLVSGAG
jgi:hypothetical protein